MLETTNYKVTFLPDNAAISVPAGTTVMSAAADAGVELEGPCGGKGTCGKCKVKLDNGESVLACQTIVDRDMTIELPQLEVSLYRKSDINSKEVSFEVEPGITKVLLEVEKPSLENQIPDAERLTNELGAYGEFKVKLEALKALPEALRKEDYKVTVTIVDNEVLAVEPGDTTNRLYGLAVDIGTTTVVGSLVNLLTGETLGTASATNAQNIFGADVIARIEHAQKPHGLEKLQQRVIQVINRLTLKLSGMVDISPEEIKQVAVVGNTTMGHLFLGLNPAYLAPSPYIPVTAQLTKADAKDLGLVISPHAPVYLLPNIAGYVGGDTVGVILSTELYNKAGVYLALDIGTNGEIVLSNNGKLYACAAAAGPAFEGAQIRQGMRAAAGAIEKVDIDDDVQLKVIDDAPATGICGSGLMDAAAEMHRAGVLASSGKMLSFEEAESLPEAIRKRLKKDDTGNYFVLSFDDEGYESVVLTQKDVRELQLAKGAMRAGAEILLSEAGLTYEDIDKVFLAGAFGNYLNKERALGIGLLPQVPLEKVESIGNAAGVGAKLALLSVNIRHTASETARNVKHIELSTRMDFQERFVDALVF